MQTLGLKERRDEARRLIEQYLGRNLHSDHLAQPLALFEMESIRRIELVVLLESALGIQLPEHLIYDTSVTIESFLAHIAGQEEH